MTESIFKNHTMTSYRQSWTSVLEETKIDYLDTLVRFRFRIQSPQSKEGIEFLEKRPASYHPDPNTQEFICQFNVKKMLGQSSASAGDMTRQLAERGIVLPRDALYSGRRVGTTLFELLKWHVDQRSLRTITIHDLTSGDAAHATGATNAQLRRGLEALAMAVKEDIARLELKLRAQGIDI
jgi:hypothetical protein